MQFHGGKEIHPVEVCCGRGLQHKQTEEKHNTSSYFLCGVIQVTGSLSSPVCFQTTTLKLNNVDVC